ncbi:MAG: lysylphosphatidylglycerol synthase transmembrane domain-containing protein [Candidatus Pacebacteria bacterium]|nr:lysylphosphatidylglycerol synthase transmembrane domain-containing protein [Candidatus Paceibacterota bacterium]MDD3919027.1 lysylphosphatidylglycerol synthase transmembrane domain-containing protein [Candidatus Paceibacterota bacterium]
MKAIKQGLLFLISILFGIAIFIYVGNIIGWDFILKSFTIFLDKEGFLIIFLSFLIAFLGGLRWKQIVKDEGAASDKISLFDYFKFYTAGFSIVYLFPIIIFGGEIFRATLLEQKAKIGWDKALASVAIERIVEWTINILVILFGTLYFFYRIAMPEGNILFIFIISIFLTLLLLAGVYFYVFRKKSFIKNMLLKMNKEDYKESLAIKTEKIVFDYFNIKNIGLWKGYFFSILKDLAMLLRVWVIIFFLGVNLDFMGSFSVLGFSFLSTLIPIPATLGTQELIQAFAFENLNIHLGVSSAFAMILRAGEVIVALTGFVLFFKAGYSFLKNKISLK